jgi:hypothetical protein
MSSQSQRLVQPAYPSSKMKMAAPHAIVGVLRPLGLVCDVLPVLSVRRKEGRRLRESALKVSLLPKNASTTGRTSIL